MFANIPFEIQVMGQSEEAVAKRFHLDHNIVRDIL